MKCLHCWPHPHACTSSACSDGLSQWWRLPSNVILSAPHRPCSSGFAARHQLPLGFASTWLMIGILLCWPTKYTPLHESQGVLARPVEDAPADSAATRRRGTPGSAPRTGAAAPGRRDWPPASRPSASARPTHRRGAASAQAGRPRRALPRSRAAAP